MPRHSAVFQGTPGSPQQPAACRGIPWALEAAGQFVNQCSCCRRIQPKRRLKSADNKVESS
eukprot:4632371-Lingulodinium_polyedra.AAC.1